MPSAPGKWLLRGRGVTIRNTLHAAWVWPLILLLSATGIQAAEPFELRDGDRVVLIGATFLERDGQFGYLETALTTSWPDRSIVVRNLGWSGDTVWAESRGIFDPAQVGYQRLITLVQELKPTVIVLGYGLNESYAGAAAIPAFVAQYEKLCNDLAVTKARLAFLTPTRLERPAPPLPDASRHNPILETYVEAVRAMASRRQAPVIDLFALPAAPQNLTENGMHFGPAGYAAVARAMRAQQKLPSPLGAEREDAIRRLVVEKNMLFFHRWRPQNITYLTGFRKHEQGNNAVEIAQFDPLVEEIERKIDALKRP